MSDLYLSWPVIVPFWMIHMDLQSQDIQEDAKGNKGYLLKYMCDISEFVVSSPTVDLTATHLVQLFVSDIIMTFGMCSVLIIDNRRSFKGLFIIMGEALDLKYWCLSWGNHKGKSVERFHIFLNKTQAIAGDDLSMHNVNIATDNTA